MDKPLMKENTRVKLVFNKDGDGSRLKAFLDEIECLSPFFKVVKVTHSGSEANQTDLLDDDGRAYFFSARTHTINYVNLPYGGGYTFVRQ
jgi:hypothetical protein